MGRANEGPLCANCGFRLPRNDDGRRMLRTRRHTSLGDQSTAVEEDNLLEPATLIEVPSVGDEETDVRTLASDTAPELNDRETAIEGVRAVRREDAYTSNLIPTERNRAVPANFHAANFRAEEPSDLVAPELPPSPLVAPSATVTSTELRAVSSISSEFRAVPPDAGGTQVTRLPRETGPARYLWVGLWICSVIAAVLVTDYLVRDATPIELGTSPIRIVAPTRIAVAETTFTRGLDEATRSTILSTCLRMQPDAADCKEDVLLAGEFPQQTVVVGAYSIDALEVTVGEYAACVDAGSCAAIDWRGCSVYTMQGLQSALRAPRSMQERRIAVTCVTQVDAAAFCGWRSGRLPTHDEWERAARGTDGRIYPWGSVWKPDVANWGELDVVRMPVPGKIDGAVRANAPGQYPDGASPVGANDMAGNVAEWIADEAVARGGSWISNPFDLRVTSRLKLNASDRRTDVGFRCAYDGS